MMPTMMPATPAATQGPPTPTKAAAGQGKSSRGTGFHAMLQQNHAGKASKESGADSSQGLMAALLAAGLGLATEVQPQAAEGEMLTEGTELEGTAVQSLQAQVAQLLADGKGGKGQTATLQESVAQTANKAQAVSAEAKQTAADPNAQLAKILAENGEGTEKAAGQKKGAEGVSESRFAEILGLRPAQVKTVEATQGKHPLHGQAAGEAKVAPGLDSAVLDPANTQEALSSETEKVAGEFHKALEGETVRQAGHEAVKTAEPLMSGNERTAATHQTGAADAKGAEIRLPSGALVGESHILEQTVEKLTINNPRETSSITLRLHPEELGHVKLELVMDKDSVRAHLHAQSQQVQEVLERHLPKLRDALEMQGLKIDQLQVSVDSQQDGNRGFFQQQNSQGSFSARQGNPWNSSRYEEPPVQVVAASSQSARDGSGLSVRI